MNIKKILENTRLFSNLNHSQFSELISQVEEVYVPAGLTFIHEGDKADALYIIKEGVVQVFTKTPNKTVILARLENGDYFGEQSLLTTSGLRMGSVRTLKESILLKVDHKLFLQIIEADKALKNELKKNGFKQILNRLKALETEFDISRYLTDMEGSFETVGFNIGEYIFNVGESSNGVYYLLSGIVDIVTKSHEGTEELIRSIFPQNLIGEANLILEQPWTSSAKAREQVKAFFIPAERFKRLYQTRPELKSIVHALHNVHQSSIRGEVIQYGGYFLHMPAIVTKFELKEGLEIVSNKVVGKNIESIHVTTTPPQKIKSYVYEDKTIYKELQLADGILVGVTAYGEWPALKELYSRIFEKKGVTETELKYFTKHGDITCFETISTTSIDEEEIICNCVYVSKGEISACIQSGCTKLADLQKKLYVGTVCGGCVPKIMTMLGHESWQAMHILKVDNLTSDIRAYRLTPIRNKPLRSFHAGQHVVIQCEIDGNWIERSYTLTSAPENLEYYEIAVKRETKGLFSRWLFHHDQLVPFIRVSHPTGHFTLDKAKSCCMICLTAGIGITPAVCFARSIGQINAQRSLIIYHTARSQEHLAYDAELESLSGKHAQIKYHKHLTEDKGRIKSEDMIQIAQQNLHADYFICGPKEFEMMAKLALQSAGINPNQIIIEQFTHANQGGA